MITFLFSCTIFNNIFISALKKANVVVTATADHNIKSGGSDIRIVRILLDGEEISFDSSIIFITIIKITPTANFND